MATFCPSIGPLGKPRDQIRWESRLGTANIEFKGVICDLFPKARTYQTT
jgi:hypothetical protein